MKSTVYKKLLKVHLALSDRLKSKKQLVAERADMLDPNNKANRQKPLTKQGRKNDGFEHRKSAETVDPALLD